MLALAIVYYTMTAANAFGAVSAMVSSGLSAIAIGFLSMPKKPKKKARCLLTLPLSHCLVAHSHSLALVVMMRSKEFKT